MLTLIMAVLIGFGGSGGVDDQNAYVYFDGTISGFRFTDDYAVITIYSCDGGSHDLIWTSEQIYPNLAVFPMAEYCSSRLYKVASIAAANDPFEVKCSYYSSSRPRHVTVSDLEWGLFGDFVHRYGYYYFCTNHF